MQLLTVNFRGAPPLKTYTQTKIMLQLLWVCVCVLQSVEYILDLFINASQIKTPWRQAYPKCKPISLSLWPVIAEKQKHNFSPFDRNDQNNQDHDAMHIRNAVHLLHDTLDQRPKQT